MIYVAQHLTKLLVGAGSLCVAIDVMTGFENDSDGYGESESVGALVMYQQSSLQAKYQIGYSTCKLVSTIPPATVLTVILRSCPPTS